MTLSKENILFLCTKNSCRSQMAEAWGLQLKSDKFNFFSAGLEASEVNPMAKEVMKESDIDLTYHKSKTIHRLREKNIDYVFTLCDEANETCPVYFKGKHIHKGFRDPPKLAENLKTLEEKKAIFRSVRDEIKDFVLNIETYILK